MNVIVTGASRGIGAAIARAFAAPGRAIVVNYLRSEEAARTVAAEVEARGARALLVQGDVRREDDLKRLAGCFDEVDVLVHNAAVAVLKPMDRIRTAQWDLTLESSLRPFWLLTRLCRFRDGASVIGLSSMGSRQYIPGYAAMGAAKAGVEALTRQLAVELAPRVRVNTVCGGLVRTDALRYFVDAEKLIAFAEQATPLGGIATPEDIADAVVWMCDRRARWMTGQVVVVDGGLSLL